MYKKKQKHYENQSGTRMAYVLKSKALYLSILLNVTSIMYQPGRRCICCLVPLI